LEIKMNTMFKKPKRNGGRNHLGILSKQRQKNNGRKRNLLSYY